MIAAALALIALSTAFNGAMLFLLYRQRRYFSPPEAALFLEQKKLRETYAEMARSIDGKLDSIYADMRRVLERGAP
jgi:hypothetical protein